MNVRQAGDSLDKALVARLAEVDRMLAEVSPEVLGDRIRRVRARQGRSIREVADRAGISKTSLVRLEQGGRVRQTTVLAVCNALGVHVNRLVEPTGGDLVVAAAHHRDDDRWHDLRDFGSGPLDGVDRPLDPDERRRIAETEGAIPLCMLNSRLPDADVLPCVLELYGPTDPRSHPGQEFVYVLSGRVLLTVGGRAYELAEHESLSFRSAEVHTYAPAAGHPTPARILSVRIGG